MNKQYTVFIISNQPDRLEKTVYRIYINYSITEAWADSVPYIH